MTPPLLLLLGSLHTAQAEYWASSAERFLQIADTIALARVEDDALVVTRAYRGTTVGAHLSLPYATPSDLPPEFLVLCGDGMCPRAIGYPTGLGFWRLEAYEFGDGASIFPGLLTEADLQAVLRGEPMGTLCLDGVVTFLETNERLPLKGSPSTATGSGDFTLDGQTWSGAFFYGEGWMSSAAGGLSIKLDRQVFSAMLATRNTDGCLAFEAASLHPLSRSKNQVTQVLTHTKLNHTLATGTVVIEGRVYPSARLTVDEDGQLALSGVPGAAGTVSLMMGTSPGGWPGPKLGFGTDSDEDRILFGLPGGGSGRSYPGTPAHLLETMVAAGGGMTWPVYRAGEVVGAASWSLAPLD